MKKPLIMLLTLLITGNLIAKNNPFTVMSPDGKIQITITIEERIYWSVSYQAKEIIKPSPLSLTVNEKVLGLNAKVKKNKTATEDEWITPVVKTKCASLRNNYNELTLTFTDNFGLVFRAFDEGVAYRFITSFKEEIKINKEEAVFNLGGDFNIWFPEEESFNSHNERLYKYLPVKEIVSPRFCSTPALIDAGQGIRVAVSESDLEDYAGLWLEGTGKNSLRGIFPGVALEVKQKSDRDVHVTKYADYIAVTQGTRSFPWRILAIANYDGELITNQLVYLLSKPAQFEDTSWIKPGKVAWDWWNFNNIYGVDFRAGINTETYKYYVDFAAANGLEYIVLDEGWYKLGNLLQITPGLDMEELVSYAKMKNVGIILWVVWKTLDDQLEAAMNRFEKWGIKAIKVDFMQRDDQWMVNYYFRIAKEAAKRKIMVDFHGAYKPSGLNRAYPNVMTSEGVKGMENSKWSTDITPGHDVTLPFIRMWAGPMDYTPGAMVNATKSDFRAVFNNPMSQGTRCHQMAMYVVFESPLQMLSDNPTHYNREAECLGFLSGVPSVWDETRVLEAKVGNFIVLARKSSNNWFIGGMTDWEPREFTIDFSFLDEGKSYTAEIFQDGINSDRNANDYKKVIQSVKKGDKLKVQLAPGGGWAAKLSLN
jgi:alpha-glucosidase